MKKSKRACRKCGNYFPWRMMVDGKPKSLQNRKFCLDCSPYGSHNTKSDDPSKPPKRASTYKNWSKEEKLLHTARVYKKGIDRKQKLIEMSGGGCDICGYNKSMRAMTFHHKNPKEKKFGLSVGTLWSKSWEKIVIEFNKCQLLCSNCHAEVEDQLAAVNSNTYRKIIEELDKRDKKPKEVRACKICKNNTYNEKYCSTECFYMSCRKCKRPNKQQLNKLRKEHTWTKIGQMFSVSDNAVRKWARRYELID